MITFPFSSFYGLSCLVYGEEPSTLLSCTLLSLNRTISQIARERALSFFIYWFFYSSPITLKFVPLLCSFVLWQVFAAPESAHLLPLRDEKYGVWVRGYDTHATQLLGTVGVCGKYKESKSGVNIWREVEEIWKEEWKSGGKKVEEDSSNKWKREWSVRWPKL